MRKDGICDRGRAGFIGVVCVHRSLSRLRVRVCASWEVHTGRGRFKKCTAATERDGDDDDDDEGGIAVGVGVGVGGVHRASSSSSVVSRVRVDVATHDEARGARRHG